MEENIQKINDLGEKIEIKDNKQINLKESIKSLYILKIIFSNVNYSSLLHIIQYNNYFQKKLNIKLKDYKKESGKYKVGGNNGEVKIYTLKKDKLLFEGEYLNGKKNGKGKEFNYKSELLYEGEYLDGIKNGKGKEYNYSTELIYEGEYLNGIKNGKAKVYNFKNELEFEGEYLNGKRWSGKGYGKDKNVIYELNNGNGKIKEYNKFDYLEFEGEIIDGKINGEGKEYYYNGKIKYEGEYLNDRRNGKGKEYNEQGKLIFEGEYKNGNRWNGKIIDNKFKIGIDFFSLSLIEAKYINGIINAKGKEYRSSHLIFEGEYVDWKKHGKGKEFDYNGNIIFEGEYINGNRWNGNGIEHKNELIVFINYKDGEKYYE